MRWSIDDPEIGFVFEVNPNSGGSFNSGRNLTKSNSTTGNPIVFFGRELVRVTEISGVIRTQEQYDNMLAWSKVARQVLLTDDLGREFWVYLQKLEMKPEPRATVPWRHTYSASLVEVSGG